MTLHKTTRYALCAAFELARAWGGPPVRAGEVAARHGLPASALAKAFQQMVRAGLAVGTRGTRGGYRLARPPRDLTLWDVLTAFEPASSDLALHRVFDEVDEIVRCTFASVSLATVVRRGTGGAGAPG